MCTLHKNKKDFRKVKKWMYELIISLTIAVIALLVYRQQATSKRYSKLRRSIKTNKELKAREKQREKERKAAQARNKRIIDRAYKAASKFTSNRKSELFRQVFNEFLKTYKEEEEEKTRLYQSASDD